MAWYDIFSRFYDSSLEKLYAEQRLQAAEALQLAPGMTVLDLPCGTGQSFDAVVDAMGTTGALLGMDASAGMLARAQERIQSRGWPNVQTAQAFAGQVTPEDIQAALGGDRPLDRVLCFLGMSAFDDFEGAFENLWSLLAPGGRMVIVDCHNKSPGLQGMMVQWIAQADLKREVWRPLERASTGFELKQFHANWQHGGDIIIASGDKPA